MRSLPLTLLAAAMALVTPSGFGWTQQPPTKAQEADDGPALAERDARELFESKIRPILVQHCYECHSAAAKTPKGGLLLDTRDGLRKGGDTGPAVVPGKVDASLIVQALEYSDESLQMPPKGKLPSAVVRDFRRWIKSGAPDPRDTPASAARKGIDLAAGRQFWSFQPLSHPQVPKVADPWSRTDIDRFLWAKLQEKGLRPAPLADRRVLIRRAYFDLLGLPPSPDDIRRFVADPDPRAYEKLVERLLESPHYGERWGRHWLDLARYADSSGYENDNDRPLAYHYRDFVIEALNRDVPYDTFVRWQIAGDELEPDSPLANKATGFFACGPMNGQVTDREAEKERYDVLDDWVSTLGTAFLGVTLGCARCHDHKFDPIGTDDYYHLVSALGSTVRVNRNIDLDPPASRRAWADFLARHNVVVQARQKFEKERLPERAAQWLTTNPSTTQSPWLVLDASRLTSGGAQTTVVTRFQRRDDGAYVVAEANGEIATHAFEAETPLSDIRALRLEVLSDLSLPKFGPGLGDHGDFQMHHIEVTATPLRGEAKPVTVRLTKVRSGTATDAPPTAQANDAGGWSFAPANQTDHWSVWEFDQPIRIEGGVRLRLQMRFTDDNPAGRKALGCFRYSIAVGDAPPEPRSPDLPHAVFVVAREAVAAPAEQRTPLQQAAIEQWAARFDSDWKKLWADERASWLARPWPKIDVALVTTEARDLVPMRMKIQGPDFYEKIFLLRRGSVEQKGDESLPGFPRVFVRSPRESQAWLPSQPPEARTSFRRAAVARWLTDVDQGAGPLLARVIVNRLWQHHLGRGLILTPSDLGAQGDRPVHPELLDWLAGELIARQWSLKALHKLIMTSSAYMQESVPPLVEGVAPGASAADQAAHFAAARRVDPDNRLFWHRPLVRLEAEAVRDAMLAVSGRLDTRPFGPGTLDEGMTRRSIYFTVKRSALIPSLVQLDWPDTLAGVGQRPTTTVAPQALLLLNNPHVRTSADAFAARLKPEFDRAPADAIDNAFLAAIGRLPTGRQRDAAVEFVRRQAATYATPDGVQTALGDLCQTLFSSNEFFYVP